MSRQRIKIVNNTIEICYCLFSRLSQGRFHCRSFLLHYRNIEMKFYWGFLFFACNSTLESSLSIVQTSRNYDTRSFSHLHELRNDYDVNYVIFMSRSFSCNEIHFSCLCIEFLMHKMNCQHFRVLQAIF